MWVGGSILLAVLSMNEPSAEFQKVITPPSHSLPIGLLVSCCLRPPTPLHHMFLPCPFWDGLRRLCSNHPSYRQWFPACKVRVDKPSLRLFAFPNAVSVFAFSNAMSEGASPKGQTILAGWDYIALYLFTDFKLVACNIHVSGECMR